MAKELGGQEPPAEVGSTQKDLAGKDVKTMEYEENVTRSRTYEGSYWKVRLSEKKIDKAMDKDTPPQRKKAVELLVKKSMKLHLPKAATKAQREAFSADLKLIVNSVLFGP